MNEMEGKNEITNYLLQGCSLARTLESNLPKMADNHPQILAHQCHEIIQVFTMARNHLVTSIHTDHHHLRPHELEVGAMAATSHEMGDIAHGFMKNDIDSEQGKDMEPSGKRIFSKRASRKDEEEGKKQRVRAAAPQIGNLDVPPEDGYSWRKYGQKEILRAKYPRSYYRCTHQKLYNCPAKKQAQRLDDDPFTFEILYRGEHICHKSSSAPFLAPPPSLAVQNITTPIKPIATVNHWLRPDFPNLYDETATSAVGSHHHHGIDVADFLDQMTGDFSSDVIFNPEDCEVNCPDTISLDDRLEAKDLEIIK